MKTYFLFSIIAVSLFVTSCKKDAVDQTPDPVTPVLPDTLTSGWTKIIVDSTETFGDIFFNNNNTGYLNGSKIYKSVNGGQTWTPIYNFGYTNIFTTSNGNLFLAGGTSLQKSSDGGNTFTAFNRPSENGADIFFVDDNHGYYSTYNKLYHTADAGSTWTQLSTTGLTRIADNKFLSMFFSNDNTGWIVNDGSIYKTSTSGLVWETAVIAGTLPTGRFSGIAATANNSVYALNGDAQLYKSTNGGANFTLLKTFPLLQASYHDIHFLDNNTGYVCIGNKIYKTTDAGNTWNVVIALGNAIVIEIHFTDANHGWACGSNGTLLIFNQ